MDLSRSSKMPRDPLSDVLSVLGARMARQTRLEASGRWALAFPAIDRLKFVAMVSGSGWVLRPGSAPEHLSEGDICVLGRTAYAIASHLDETPVDGQALYAGGRDVVRLDGDDTIAIGGTITFTAGHADFLLDVLPECMVVARSSPASDAVAIILDLMNRESKRDTMGRAIVGARLGDVLLVEAIRTYADTAGSAKIGWLGALIDPRLGRVLQTIHDKVAHPWTVAQLAGLAGMSRAAFSAEFARRVGQPPLAYLRSWRLTLARAALVRGDATVASVANSAGYMSQSAFTYAYRRRFGVPPTSKQQHCSLPENSSQTERPRRSRSPLLLTGMRVR
ncbi:MULTISPECIES: AraC family transcriptional regulator [unclassified Sphingomonas]|nr:MULTISPECIES: AraC family transcriptional regulator [unclassified Sphingomonas]